MQTKHITAEGAVSTPQPFQAFPPGVCVRVPDDRELQVIDGRRSNNKFRRRRECVNCNAFAGLPGYIPGGWATLAGADFSSADLRNVLGNADDDANGAA